MTVCKLRALSPRSRHLDHPLAGIVAGQQPDQRLWRVLKPLQNVFLHLDLAGGLRLVVDSGIEAEPAAADTTTVSPAFGLPTSRSPK